MYRRPLRLNRVMFFRHNATPQDNEGIIAPNPPPPHASLPALSDFWP
jgi:hypothetical protein